MRRNDESEEIFQQAQDHWMKYKDRESSDLCFSLIYACCENMVKSKLKGVYITDVCDVAMDATIIAFGKMKGGEHIRKLSSFCYYPVIQVLYSAERKREDKEISYEWWTENVYDKQND